MKEFITDTLIKFQKGRLTLREATERLATRTARDQSGKAKSNRRLKNLCGALRRESNAAKVGELKRSLRREFYYGDRAS